MRTGMILSVIVTVAAMLTGLAGAADLKAVKAQEVKDLTVAVLSESGRWQPGKNAFVLRFTRAARPVDVGKVTLTTSMPMPGMAPMLAGATLEPDGPGRYRGTISFPDAGDRQVTVSWDGPAGTGSTRFSVPVR